MAMDTAAKRGTAMLIRSPWRKRLPLPDATIDQGDRQATAFMYSGILAGAAVVTATLVDRWANVLEINTDPIGRLELQAEVIA